MEEAAAIILRWSKLRDGNEDQEANEASAEDIAGTTSVERQEQNLLALLTLSNQE